MHTGGFLTTGWLSAKCQNKRERGAAGKLVAPFTFSYYGKLTMITLDTLNGTASDIAFSHLMMIIRHQPKQSANSLLMIAACLAANRPLALRELRQMLDLTPMDVGRLARLSPLLTLTKHPTHKCRKNVTLSLQGEDLKEALLEDDPSIMRGYIDRAATAATEIGASGRINKERLPKHVQAYIASLEAKVAA